MATQEDNQTLLGSSEGGIYHIGDDFMVLPACPTAVVGDFILTDAHFLTSLRGVPRDVTGVFHIAYCDALVSWEGSTLESCGEMDIMLSNMRTCTGGPSSVGSRILVAPGTDLYDLPGGSWYTIIFGEGYMTYERSDVAKVVESLSGCPQEGLEFAAGEVYDPLRVWVASRMLAGLPLFRSH